MPLKVAIADYGVGNLHSIRKALENAGAAPTIVRDMRQLLDAPCLVLPGVGAFDKTLERLSPYREQIVESLANGTPCLGICIGAQILFDGSDEGTVPGLGFYSGRVVRLRAKRVPHMGWNSVVSADPLMRCVSAPYFYFAHSYYGSPAEAITVGETDYFGAFPSLFRKVNTYGTQFHPEKSSGSGMEFLRAFVEFAEAQL
jgi:glutamine amidotransferase